MGESFLRIRRGRNRVLQKKRFKRKLHGSPRLKLQLHPRLHWLRMNQQNACFERRGSFTFPGQHGMAVSSDYRHCVLCVSLALLLSAISAQLAAHLIVPW